MPSGRSRRIDSPQRIQSGTGIRSLRSLPDRRIEPYCACSNHSRHALARLSCRVEVKRSVAIPNQQYVVLLQIVNSMNQSGQVAARLEIRESCLSLFYFSLQELVREINKINYNSSPIVLYKFRLCSTLQFSLHLELLQQ